jgi:hypothetical protein
LWTEVYKLRYILLTITKHQDGDNRPFEVSSVYDVRSLIFFALELPIGVTLSFLIGFGGAWGVSSPIGTARIGSFIGFIGFILIAVFYYDSFVVIWGCRDSRDSALDFKE